MNREKKIVKWFHEIIVSHHQNIPGYDILIYRLTGSVRLAYLMTQITATMMKAVGDDVVDISPPKLGVIKYQKWH